MLSKPLLPVDEGEKEPPALSTTGGAVTKVPKLPASRRHAAPSYIPHLDGLRAIALVGVVLYHFEIGPLPGGYTGVDVFFVLSGFLMTRNIRNRIWNNEFSLREFYVARFWRLYPASLCTSICALIGAKVVFTPDLQTSTLWSAIASALMSSNTLFSTEIGGYFDPGANTKPLLHTWSLSLEEQFYFVWPILLIATTAPLVRAKIENAGRDESDDEVQHRNKRRDRPFLLTLAAITSTSFVAAAYLSRRSMWPVFAWFHLPTRAYEFTAGALAFKIYDRVGKSRVTQTGMSLLGLGLIIASYIYLDKSAVDVDVEDPVVGRVDFPGWASLPPVLGTVLVIMSPESRLSVLLTNAIMRYLGKVSYAAYLVHWPVWVFLVFSMENSRARLPALVATLLLAQVLHSGIEAPLRRPSKPRAHVLVGMCGLFVGCAILLAVHAREQPSIESLSDPGACPVKEGESFGGVVIPRNERYESMKVGFRRASWLPANQKQCEMVVTHSRRPSSKEWDPDGPKVITIGDSFGAMGVAVGAALDKGYAMTYSRQGCFLPFTETKEKINSPDFVVGMKKLGPLCDIGTVCAQYFLRVLPPATKVVFVMFRWDKWRCSMEPPTNATTCRSLSDPLEWLRKEVADAGRRVVVVSSPPMAQMTKQNLVCLKRDGVVESVECPIWGSELEVVDQWNQWVRVQTERLGMEFMDLGKIFCRPDNRTECLLRYCDRTIFSDTAGHLTEFGRSFLVPHFRELLEQSASP